MPVEYVCSISVTLIWVTRWFCHLSTFPWPSKSPSVCCLHRNIQISFWLVQESGTYIWLQILPGTWKSWCSEQDEGHGTWGGRCGYGRFQLWETSCHEVKSQEIRCVAASCLFKKQHFYVFTKSLSTQLYSHKKKITHSPSLSIESCQSPDQRMQQIQCFLVVVDVIIQLTSAVQDK